MTEERAGERPSGGETASREGEERPEESGREIVPEPPEDIEADPAYNPERPEWKHLKGG